MKAPMFEISEIADLLRSLQVKGMKLSWRTSPRLKSGGTWVAQISQDGHYLRVSNTDAIKAIRTLADRFKQEPKPAALEASRFWRRWSRVWTKNEGYPEAVNARGE